MHGVERVHPLGPILLGAGLACPTSHCYTKRARDRSSCGLALSCRAILIQVIEISSLKMDSSSHSYRHRARHLTVEPMTGPSSSLGQTICPVLAPLILGLLTILLVEEGTSSRLVGALLCTSPRPHIQLRSTTSFSLLDKASFYA